MDNTEDFFKNYRGKYSQYWVERWGLIPELPTSFDNANSMYEFMAWLQRAFKNLLDDFQQLEAETEDFKNAIIDLLEYLIPELIRRYHDSAEFRAIFIILLEDILAGEERNWVKDLLKEVLEVDMREWLEAYLKELYGVQLQAYFMELANARGSYPTLSERVEVIQNKLFQLSNTINAITTGEESSAEVMSARTALDGAIYKNLSESIKAQFSNIYNSDIKFVHGYIDLNGNNQSIDDLWYRTDDYYPIEDIINAEIQSRPDASAIAYYDMYKNFIGRQGGDKIERITSMQVPVGAKYVRFCFHFEDPTHAILTKKGSGVIKFLAQLISSLQSLGENEIIDSISDNRVTEGFYISLDNELVEKEDWATTDYFVINDIETVLIPSRDGAIGIGYYGWDKELLSYETLGQSQLGNTENAYLTELRRNTGAVFVRFSIHKILPFKIILKSRTESRLARFERLFNIFGFKVVTVEDAKRERPNHYISTDGVFTERVDWHSLNRLVPIESIVGVNIRTMLFAGSIAYYTEDKNFISAQGGDGQYLITKMIVPVGAKYVRFCFNEFFDEDSNYILIKQEKSMLDWLPNKSESARKLEGKNVGFIGDSITAGVGATKLYSDLLAEKYGFMQYTKAVGGAQTNNMLGYAQELKAMNIKFDCIFVLGGTNDFNSSVELGNFFTLSNETVNKNGNMVELKKRTPIFDDTFYGRLNSLSNYLKTNFPDTRIIYLTPIHRAYFESGSTNIQPSELYANLNGYFIDDYVDLVKKAGTHWSIEVIDLFTESSLHPLTESYGKFFVNSTTDLLHPNNLGHELIASTIARKL